MRIFLVMRRPLATGKVLAMGCLSNWVQATVSQHVSHSCEEKYVCDRFSLLKWRNIHILIRRQKHGWLQRTDMLHLSYAILNSLAQEEQNWKRPKNNWQKSCSYLFFWVVSCESNLSFFHCPVARDTFPINKSSMNFRFCSQWAKPNAQNRSCRQGRQGMKSLLVNIALSVRYL